jgi:hypothetical protein
LPYAELIRITIGELKQLMADGNNLNEDLHVVSYLNLPGANAAVSE